MKKKKCKGDAATSPLQKSNSSNDSLLCDQTGNTDNCSSKHKHNTILDWSKSFTGDIPDLDYVLPGLLAGTTGAIVGAGSTGKSFFCFRLGIGYHC